MNTNRKKIGLALGSGGWRGLAHIGVIKTLIKEGIQIDYIAGSSAGALVGGLYSYFGNTAEIEAIVGSLSYRSLYGMLFDPALASGFIDGKKYVRFLEKFIGEIKIEDLNIPFTAVCSDLFSGQSVGITSGKLSEGIRASSSIPILFKPKMINGRFLVDGGNSMPVPTQIVRDMGAEIVIGVNLYGNIFPFKMEYLKKEKVNSAAIIRISYQMMLNSLAKENLKLADVQITPEIFEGNFSIFKNFVNNQTTVEDGEKAAEKILPALKLLL